MSLKWWSHSDRRRWTPDISHCFHLSWKIQRTQTPVQELCFSFLYSSREELPCGKHGKPSNLSIATELLNQAKNTYKCLKRGGNITWELETRVKGHLNAWSHHFSIKWLNTSVLLVWPEVVSVACTLDMVLVLSSVLFYLKASRVHCFYAKPSSLPVRCMWTPCCLPNPHGLRRSLQLGLPDLAHKNPGHPVQFQFQINNG